MLRLKMPDDFNAHVETCRQCGARGDDLCHLGKMLVLNAAAEAMVLLARSQTLAEPTIVNSGTRRGLPKQAISGKSEPAE
jgi:hypothetical protein